MKHVFSIMLLYLIYGKIIAESKFNRKIYNEMKEKNLLKKIKEKQRKLQIINMKHRDYKSISSSMEEPIKKVSTDETLLKGSKRIDNLNAAVQIKKIYNFQIKQKQISFKIFFYYFGKKIVEFIFLKIKIKYKNILRNLQGDIQSESVIATCSIMKEHKDKVNFEGTGENINYDCFASLTLSSEINNVSLETDYPLNLDGEIISFDKINFENDAAKEAENFINAPQYDKSGSLDNAKVEFPIHFNYFRIRGILNPENLLSKGDVIPIQFVEFNKGQKMQKKISCTAINIKKPNCTLKCDTTNQPIKTTINNINLARSIDSDIYLTFNMKQDDSPVETPFPKNVGDTKFSSDFSLGVFFSIIIICIIIIIASTIEINKFEIVVSCLISVLLIATFVKDWCDFAVCGAVERCLLKKEYIQYYFKFFISLLITILAFMVAKRAIYKRDALLIRLGFFFSMWADFGFSIIKAFFPKSMLSSALGIGFFMIFQLIMIFRHSRESENDNHFPKIYIAPLVILVVFIILCAVGVVSLVIGFVAIYASILICSLIVSVRVPCKNYYQPRNAKFIRWGMILFTIGDVMVGCGMLSGEDHSAKQIISCIANNIIWILYIPGQILLIMSSVEKILFWKQ